MIGEFKLSSIAEVIKDGNVIDKKIFTGNNSINEVEVTTRDKKNNVISYKKFPMKSFVYNFNLALYYYLSRYLGISLKDTSGSDRDSVQFRLDSDFNDDTGGIIVGSDPGSFLPLAVSNYSLGTKLYKGTGLNQLVYNNTQITSPKLVGDNYLFEISRVFTNSSSGSLTIQEIGLVAYYRILIARDIEDSNGDPINITLGIDESVEIKYILKINVNSGFTKSFLDALYNSMRYNRYVGYSSVNKTSGYYIDTANNTHLVTSSSNILEANATLHEDSYGVIVGSGIEHSTVLYDQIKLDIPILQGSIDGTLKYEYTEFLNHYDPDDATKYHTHIQRAYVNEGDADVLVTEAGVYGIGEDNNRYMTMRVYYPGGVLVKTNESLRISFIITTGL